MVEQVIVDIKNKLAWMFDIEEITAVLLFGSQATGKSTSLSDFDLCIVARSVVTAQKKAELLGKIWSKLDANKYDIWLFEELSLSFQLDIIHTHEIIFCEDIPDLYEYFYRFRKLWRTQSHRQSLSFEVQST